MEKKVIKDTAKNRMRAIEAIVAGSTNIDITVTVATLKESKIKRSTLERLLVEADKMLTDVFYLSHGYNSSCCKGSGSALIEPAIKSYE